MKFESYAQHGEDIILYCALKDVEKGFYIDVGANDPVVLSVTKAFYDRGWHGINIEPLNDVYAKLQAERPRDINLCIGCGEEHGILDLYECDMLSTFSVAEATRQKLPENKKKSHPIWTLSEVYENYCPQSTVHFCKVDVEGYEREVLLGVKDWRKFRPWIFVMEATLPRTRTTCHEQWEQILLDNDYIFAFKYGINRYYVAAEKEYLVDNFAKVNQFVAENEVWQMVWQRFKERIG